MSDHKERGAGKQPWTLRAANVLEMSESVVLVVIGVALVLVAVLLLYSSVYDLNEAVRHGTGEIETKAIGILNTVGSSRVDLQACKLEYSIVSPK